MGDLLPQQRLEVVEDERVLDLHLVSGASQGYAGVQLLLQLLPNVGWRPPQDVVLDDVAGLGQVGPGHLGGAAVLGEVAGGQAVLPVEAVLVGVAALLPHALLEGGLGDDVAGVQQIGRAHV